MSGTWRVGRVAGIPVQVHWSVGLLVPWFALRGQPNPAGWWLDAVYGVLLALVVLGCVVLHELGHGLAARAQGIGVRDITLLPIGGLARLEVGAGQWRPGGEALIALAGPAVNAGLALLLGPLAWWASGADGDGPAALLREVGHLSPAGVVGALLLGNLLLAGVNLLPIYPLDGGRLLRALLAWRGDQAGATRLAAGIGQVLAVALVAIGLGLASPALVVAAGLLVVAATHHGWPARRGRACRGEPVAKNLHRPDQVGGKPSGPTGT